MAYNDEKPNIIDVLVAIRDKSTSGGGSSAGLTDAQLRASAVPVSGPLTDAQLRASALTSQDTPDVMVTGATASAVNTDLLTGNVSGWYDAALFRSAAFQVIGSAGISAGSVIFEQTNDVTAAGVALPVMETAAPNGPSLYGAFAISASTSRLFVSSLSARYVRARVNAVFTGGTVQVIAAFSQKAHAHTVMAVSPAIGSNAASATLFPIARSFSANPTVGTTGRNIDLLATMIGALVVKPYSIPDLDWQASGASGGIVNTTDVVMKASAGSGVRNYVTALQLRNTHATVATEVVVKDAATVIWRGWLPAAMANAEDIVFPTPLRGSTNAVLNIACITTGASVYWNAQGYAAP